MVSKQAWESFKRVVEDFTNAGVVQESCGKRSSNKGKLNNTHEVKTDDEIVGFSSSDDDETSVQSVVKTYPSSAKRALIGQKPATSGQKRRKKHDEDHNRPWFPPRTPRTSNSCSKSDINVKKWKIFSNAFENSFTAESSSSRSFCHPTSSSEHSKRLERKDEMADSITWSDSDSEDREISQIEGESPDVMSQDKIPLSTQCVEQEQQNQDNGNIIDEFDSDGDSCTEQLVTKAKEESPSISPNTPTPTPTPCSPKEGENRPPLNSTKKRKQKYLRSGLAERLHRLSMQESSNKSFWSHKIQQMKRESDSEHTEYPSADGTVTLRVISESLDHGVYVISCHVVSQDGEPFLPKHVIVLLESEIRKHLDIRLTSTFLRVYSPWKILHLSDFSSPVLLCMAHCEVISASSFVPDLDISPQVEQQLTEVKSSTTDGIDLGSDLDYDEDREEPVTSNLDTVVDWNLQDVVGYQGLCVASRVNVTARVQRIFWRSVEMRDRNICSASSLVVSIIENSKTLQKDKRMSLCCLLQCCVTGVYCEVRLPENILLNREDWHEMLREGAVLSFSKLRVLEHRKRKRRRELFDLIDSLNTTKHFKETAEDQSFKRFAIKQQTCVIFVVDEHSLIKQLSEDKVSDYPRYSSPESLTFNYLNSAAAIDGRRLRAYGKLLYANFTSDKYYNTRHVSLWLSGIFDGKDCAESDVIAEPAVSVIQVRYSSGRTVDWNESTLFAGQLLSMQDLVFKKAKPAILTADVFSKIQMIIAQSSRSDSDAAPFDIHEVWRRTMTTSVADEEYDGLKSLPVPELSYLSDECAPDSLVKFEGIVFDVDQENAFSWYTCCHCGSEDVMEMQDSSLQYHCTSCNLEFNSPVTNIHLEVYLKSLTTPDLKVKMKLLQQTTARLLSGSDKDSGEGYDVSCVLNKQLGPLYCHVVAKTQDEDCKISFKLEELDSSCWIK